MRGVVSMERSTGRHWPFSGLVTSDMGTVIMSENMLI